MASATDILSGFFSPFGLVLCQIKTSRVPTSCIVGVYLQSISIFQILCYLVIEASITNLVFQGHHSKENVHPSYNIPSDQKNICWKDNHSTNAKFLLVQDPFLKFTVSYELRLQDF